MRRISWNRTKIVATLGPATGSYKTVKQLITSGVDVVRLNLSHGSREEHSKKVKIVRAISKSISRPIAILADLPGPKLRVGELTAPRELIRGKEIILSATVNSREKKNTVSIKYANLPDEVKPGDTIYLDDGAIKLRVKAKSSSSIICKVIIGGWLKSEAGINLPGTTLKTEFLTLVDKALISFVIKEEIDLLALSFVRKAADVKQVRDILKKKRKNIFLISKIEKHEALKDIDNIIDVSDGIMVARGDLGVEVPVEKVALIQKSIIKKCNRLGKPVITATQMLESMLHNPRATRAEVADVTNAILDGTDAVMLSGETAIGKYPLEAVKTMVKIARYVENNLDYSDILSQRHKEIKDTVTDTISFSACEIAWHLKAKVIVTPTRSGLTARMVSRYRPKAVIIAPTPNNSVLRHLCLSWGVYPLKLQEKKHLDSIITEISNILEKEGLLESKDVFVITGGSFRSAYNHTNFVRVETVV